MERHLLKTIHNTLDVETDYLNARENFYAAANTVLEKSATYAASLKSLLEDLLKAEPSEEYEMEIKRVEYYFEKLDRGRHALIEFSKQLTEAFAQ